MKSSYLGNERGMTLIEVLAAVVILGIVVVAFMDISGYSLVANKKSDQFEEAMRLAESRLNIAKELVYTDPTNLLSKTETVEEYTVIYQVSQDLQQPEITYQTAAFESEHVSMQSVVVYENKASLLTVTVTWGDADE